MNDIHYNHKARKRFGQNFLIDHGIIRQIVRAIHPQQQERLLEIGPGQGAITASLLEHCPQLHAVELDRDLIPLLKSKFAGYLDFKIHEADALGFDYASILNDSEQLRVVGNLPYNISTPLIFHLLSFKKRIQDMHFMLQKEVVMRLAAAPREKNYGRLSIMTQYHCAVEYLFDVPPECFQPAPKVTSAIVRMVPHKQLPHVAKNEEHMANLVKLAFQQRRKTLRNAIKPLIENVDQQALTIDLNLRAEQLSIADFVMLSNQLVNGA